MQLINDESRIQTRIFWLQCLLSILRPSCLSVLLTPILTVLTSNTLLPTWTTNPVRPDFSLPWNAPNPFLSLCFHTALKMPSLLFSAYSNPTYSSKSNWVPPPPSRLPWLLKVLFHSLQCYISHRVHDENLGLNFTTSLFPQYSYSFNKRKNFKTLKIPLKVWILV